MPPVKFIVPVETETTQFRPAVALPGIAILAAFKVPVPTANVLVAAAEGEFIVTAPATVSVLEPLMLMLFDMAGALIVRDAHVAAGISTVQTAPEGIVTVVAAVGTPAGVQFAAVDQFPVPVKVLCANAGITANNSTSITKAKRLISNEITEKADLTLGWQF
jgi:hypothetical protein